MHRPILILACAALVPLAACAGSAASTGAAGSPAPQQQSRGSADVITTEELAQSAGTDLYAAIQRSRPSFLQVRGNNTFGNSAPGSNDIQVYVDGMHRGGLSVLREINSADVAEVRHLSASEATQRFGTGN